MRHCALAPIPGRGGMAGPVMSHDFVEAALMRRAGYEVWLVSDLAGSYEQQQPDLLSELQRDRRWCQGNLQNSRLMAVFLSRDQQTFGGARAPMRSAAAETLLAVLQAPVRMLAHSLFVLVALTGLKLEWKSPPREAAAISWRDAAARLSPMTGLVGLLALAAAWVDPAALVLLAPVAWPLLLAVPLAVFTSHVSLGCWMRERGC